MAEYGEWNRKGATLTDVSALKELITEELGADFASETSAVIIRKNVI